MDIAAIRQALANAVGTIAGVQVHPSVPDSITAPAFGAGEVEIDYDQTFHGGLTVLLCKGRLYHSRAAGADSDQPAMDAYLMPAGPTSIKAAIEADRTLGGVCQALRVERLHGYATYQVGGVDYLGAEFDVRVWAT